MPFLLVSVARIRRKEKVISAPLRKWSGLVFREIDEIICSVFQVCNLVIATATDPRAVEDDGPHGIPH